MKYAGRILPAVLVVAMAAMGGCAKDTAIVLQYDRPAQTQVPEGIRKVAITDFSAPQHQEQYGQLVAEKLSGQLDHCNKKFDRYALVDRRNLKKILDERGMQMAMSDSGQAVNAGKILNADAIIFGSVKVQQEDIHGTKMVPGYANGGVTMHPVPTVKRVVTATLSFSMDNVNNGASIVTRSLTETYDSDKENKSLLKEMGMGGDDRKATSEAAGVLIDRAVQKFVALISAHVVEVNIVLAKGKSSKVPNGNALAEAKEYAEALAVYQEALAEKPEDHGAAFNAGVMCEGMGKMKEADEWYTKAIHMDATNKEYIACRARVRAEMSNGNGGPTTNKSDKTAKGD